jgi:V/A-type H+-transporting ATPase subunit E
MSGLEAILNQIKEEAEKNASQYLEKANTQREEILQEAAEQGEKEAEALVRQGEAKAQEIRDRAHSAAALEKRNKTLAFKQQQIRQVIDETRKSLETAPDDVYFQTVLQLLSRFALPEDGEMHMNEADLNRMPADFSASAAAAVTQGKVTLSKIPYPIESGFVLVYGGIEINCTFKAIFEDAYDQLRDTVGAILFPEV